MASRKKNKDHSVLKELLWFQMVLIAIGLGIRAFFWASQTPISTLALLAGILAGGNLASLVFRMSLPIYTALKSPWNLVARVVALALIGVAATLLTQITAFHFYSRPGSHFLWSASQVRLGILMTLVISVALYLTIYLYIEMKSRLEARNEQLQGQVQLGEKKQQAQEADLQQAYDIQRHLLPRETPQLPGFQIACAWQPAKTVSGDYFDVFPLGEDRMALCLADVAGKGVAAALLMANLQASVRALAHEETSPAVLCAKLNGLLCETVAPGKFVTFFYGIVEKEGCCLHYENAGHCLPLLIRKDGSIEFPASYSGVLGLFSHWTYQDNDVPLRPGDCLLLMTDGVLEAADKKEEEFGYQRLIDVVQKRRGEGAHVVRQAVLAAVSSFCLGQFQDDASLIVLTVD